MFLPEKLQRALPSNHLLATTEMTVIGIFQTPTIRSDTLRLTRKALLIPSAWGRENLTKFLISLLLYCFIDKILKYYDC